MKELKIFVLGDFHGKLPKKLIKIIKNKDFDLIITPGDFAGDKEMSKLFFKYAYGTGKPLSDFIGKKKAKKIEDRNLNAGISIVKKLNSIGKPVIAVTGNWDYTKWFDVAYRYTIMSEDKKYISKFYSVLNKSKNIHIVDFASYKMCGLNFVGYPRSSYPGFISKKRIAFLRKKYGKKALRIIKQTNSDNKRYYAKIKRLFTENTVFIPHNAPYMTKLDKIKQGPQKGKHYGSYLARKVILELKPILVICGHMHENPGIIKLGKTVVVNPGPANEGRAAVIKIDLERKKIKSVKLI